MSTKSTLKIDLADNTGGNSLIDPANVNLGFAANINQPAEVGASLGTTAMVGSTKQLTNVLYATEAGDHSAISVGDINQGQLGDCFLLSAIGELAIYDPAAITKMISITASGTESVTLFEALNGSVPGFGATHFAATSQAVSNSFSAASVNNGANQDVVGANKEIWAQVIEKAYAQANGGYATIARGGNPCIALQQLTGHKAEFESPALATKASLTANVAAGDLVVMDTANSSNLPYGLMGGHAYMFEGLVTSNGVSSVRLGNPWGFDQPSLIPLTQLSHSGIVEVDIGHTH